MSENVWVCDGSCGRVCIGFPVEAVTLLPVVCLSSPFVIPVPTQSPMTPGSPFPGTPHASIIKRQRKEILLLKDCIRVKCFRDPDTTRYFSKIAPL